MAANVDWKGSLPIITFLFAVAALSFAGVQLAGGFLGNIVIGTVWLLLAPLLSASGVSKEVNTWFVRAAAFAYLSAAFVLLGGTFIDTGNWSQWLVEIGIILSWLMAGIGGLIALGTTK